MYNIQEGKTHETDDALQIQKYTFLIIFTLILEDDGYVKDVSQRIDFLSNVWTLTLLGIFQLKNVHVRQRYYVFTCIIRVYNLD